MSWHHLLPAACAIALGLALPALVYLLAYPLALLVLAITLAATLAPAADVLDRRMPRSLAVSLLYAALVGVIAALLSTVFPTLWQELQDLVARAPALLDQAQRRVERWLPLQQFPVRDAIVAVLKNFQNTLMQVPMQALGALFDLLVIFFLSLYLLIAGPSMKRFILTLIPPSRRRRTGQLMHRIGSAMGGYLRGAAISGVLVGLLTWGALSLVGLEYRRTLAIAAAFGEFVPYIGPILAAVPAVLVALGHSPGQAAVVALIYVGLQQVESYIITPNVMKSQTDVPPALVILALVSGFTVGGLVGALAAIPLFAALRVVMLAAAPVLRHWSAKRGDTWSLGHSRDGISS